MRGSQNGFQTWSKWRGNNRIPAQQQNFWRFFQKHLAKWLSLLGISEEVIKMASILMPTQKFQSGKRHQFWCHRRKMAPFRSHEPDKREIGSESEPKIKNFREKRIKIGFSCSTPWWRFFRNSGWPKRKKFTKDKREVFLRFMTLSEFLEKSKKP